MSKVVDHKHLTNVEISWAAISTVLELLNSGQPTAALDQINQLIECNCPIAGLWYAKALALARLDRITEALESTTQLLSIEPTHIKGQHLLGELQSLTNCSNKPNETKVYTIEEPASTNNGLHWSTFDPIKPTKTNNIKSTEWLKLLT